MPALGAAHASTAPASAAYVGRSAAELLFLCQSLKRRLWRPPSRAGPTSGPAKFALAAAYNLVAAPFAVMGHVTPLVRRGDVCIIHSGRRDALRLKGLGGWRRAARVACPATAVLEAAE